MLKYCMSLIFLIMASFSSSLAYADNFTPQQQADIQHLIHDYLINHPQLLIQMSQQLEKQTETQWQKTATTVVPKIAPQLFNSKVSPQTGNLNGNVTLVEFFDYQCPHCKDMGPLIQHIINTDKQVHVIYKVLPIFGANSLFASKASLAVYQINPAKFHDFNNALLKIEIPLTPDVVLKIAEQTGINLTQLKTAIKNPAFDTEINDNTTLAKSLELTGTPGFIMAHVIYNPVTHTMLTFKHPVLIPGAVNNEMLLKAISEARGG